MNADPEVREHLGALLTREQSDAAVALMQTEFDERGFGWWALEAQETGGPIGRVGLDEVGEDMPFAGVDIGWRLMRSAWGHGYATEAALACLAFGFETLALPEVVASTTVHNLRSPGSDAADRHGPGSGRRLRGSERAEGALRQCVLYRIPRDAHDLHHGARHDP